MIQAAPNAEAYLEALRLYLGARYSDHTVDAFLRQSRQFLRAVGVKPRYGRADVLRYLDGLIRRGYKSGSIHTMLAGVRALFRALDQPWPLDRADLHLGLPDDDAHGPALAPSEVAALIERRALLGYPDRQLLALASVWGFRNSELAALLTAGCDGVRLEVQTAKRGRRRVHEIPAPLGPVLTFPGVEIGGDGVHKRFDAVMRTLRNPATGEGWHAFRRAVASGLHRTGLSQYTVSKFMAWRVAETAFIYDRRDPAEIDAEVYRVHPFLKLWGLPARGTTC